MTAPKQAQNKWNNEPSIFHIAVHWNYNQSFSSLFSSIIPPSSLSAQDYQATDRRWDVVPSRHGRRHGEAIHDWMRSWRRASAKVSVEFLFCSPSQFFIIKNFIELRLHDFFSLDEMRYNRTLRGKTEANLKKKCNKFCAILSINQNDEKSLPSTFLPDSIKKHRIFLSRFCTQFIGKGIKNSERKRRIFFDFFALFHFFMYTSLLQAATIEFQCSGWRELVLLNSQSSNGSLVPSKENRAEKLIVTRALD